MYNQIYNVFYINSGVENRVLHPATLLRDSLMDRGKFHPSDQEEGGSDCD